MGNIAAGAAGGGTMWSSTSVFDNVFEVFNWTASNPPITLNFVQGRSFLNSPGFIGGDCMLNSAYTFEVSTGVGNLEAHLFTDMGNSTDQMD